MKPDFSKYQAFFFDFDGVLVDTVDIKTRAFGELFKKYGTEVSAKVRRHHLGNGGVSRYEKFRHYYKHLLKKPISETVIKQLDRRYSALVENKVIKASYIKGAGRFIRELSRGGKLCFVISGTPQKEIRRIVRARGLEPFFKDTLGSPKDKTFNLGMLLRKYKVAPGEAVYFGDATSDWEAAGTFGIDFVSVVNKKSRELCGKRSLCEVRDLSGLSLGCRGRKARS